MEGKSIKEKILYWGGITLISTVIIGGSYYIYQSIFGTEEKEKEEKILSPTQKLYLLKDINSEKSLDLLILFALLFDLGFNIYQVSRIKVKDIYFNQEIIEISYKGHRKVRKINFEMAQILKEHINKQKLNASNYLIYNEFIETKLVSRYKHLNSLIYDLILK